MLSVSCERHLVYFYPEAKQLLGLRFYIPIPEPPHHTVHLCIPMPSLVIVLERGLGDLIPSPFKGHDLKSEIECYSLPYGGLGFVSHFLTYYTLLCLWLGRSPLWPFRKATCSKWDLALALTSLITTTALAIYTMVKCRDTWQLLVIAVWKLSMSLLNGITAVNTSILILREGMREDFMPRIRYDLMNSARWIGLYVPGMSAGMVGLMSLVIQHWNDRGIVKLTIAFYSIVGFGVVLGILEACRSTAKRRRVGAKDVAFGAGIGILIVSPIVFIILAAFYSDWALGMMTDNLLGLPTNDNTIFYWTYFAAKRLPMFSW
ncbi:hypothetical protein AX16_001662 [Volvariella volvacea WC 439]|nr:hypothetical protein AX16_001662 [Volvariella volvacea WC 439]